MRLFGTRAEVSPEAHRLGEVLDVQHLHAQQRVYLVRRPSGNEVWLLGEGERRRVDAGPDVGTSLNRIGPAVWWQHGPRRRRLETG